MIFNEWMFNVIKFMTKPSTHLDMINKLDNLLLTCLNHNQPEITWCIIHIKINKNQFNLRK